MRATSPLSRLFMSTPPSTLRVPQVSTKVKILQHGRSSKSGIELTMRGNVAFYGGRPIYSQFEIVVKAPDEYYRKANSLLESEDSLHSFLDVHQYVRPGCIQ